jgi:flagellar biosynthesis component FlhA
VASGIWLERSRRLPTFGLSGADRPALPAPGAVLKLPFEEETEEEAALLIALDASVLFKLYEMNAERYSKWWNDFRADFFSASGLLLPNLKVAADSTALAASYGISLRGSEIDHGQVILDSVLVELNPDFAGVMGLEIAAEVAHPVNGSAVFWAMQSASLRRIIDAAQIRTFDFFEYIALKVAAFILSHPEEGLSLAHIHGQLKMLEKKHPGMVEEALNRDFLNVARITELLQALAKEKLNVRDFAQYVEIFATYCSGYGASMAKEGEFDRRDIVNFTRLQRRRQLGAQALSPRRTIKAITLTHAAEQHFEHAVLNAENAQLAIEPEMRDALRGALQDLVEPVRTRGILPLSIVCASGVRERVAAFCREVYPALSILSFDELEAGISIEPVGEW